eukprot:3663918-Prymnesium_polylepis.1
MPSVFRLSRLPFVPSSVPSSIFSRPLPSASVSRLAHKSFGLHVNSLLKADAREGNIGGDLLIVIIYH